ncbi:hypothetical protein [[Enterobacter] lignolyticus]|uniref:Transmembrane protein n=1 Tax=Enterobacter lignolyticus (strain SCF1) TaxID=701347 RepID=E3G8S8_ENTLS|nr:hypothetical protein [[Enterobacter] lignolyticus]ADO48649.1 hypothetical protein Entcl_2398 [[Enterobacter] lignolyticus SCF1]
MRYNLQQCRRFIFSKTFAVMALVSTALLLIFWYMLWASALSGRTALDKSFPELTIYLTVCCIIGVIFAARAVYRPPAGKTPKYVFEVFGHGFCLGLMLVLNSFDVYVYLFPDKTVQYVSDYDVVFPGPSRGKSGHCEAGIWIDAPYSHRQKQLCTNKTDLFLRRKQGMDGVWVTARVNKLGTYIVDYTFIYK